MERWKKIKMAANHLIAGKFNKMKWDNKGLYRFDGSMPWTNKNRAVSDKSFAIAVMKV